MQVDFSHPANQRVIEYLKNPYLFYDSSSKEALQKYRKLRERHLANIKAEQSPEQIEQPYYDLGIAAKIVARVWDELPYYLPEECRWVVYEHPVLVHPKSGIIFAWGDGAKVYAIRLPDRERSHAIAHAATTVLEHPDGIMQLDLEKIGPEWILGAWLYPETRWCLTAYERIDGRFK